MIKNIQILGLVGLATVNPIWIMLNQQSMSPIIVSSSAISMAGAAVLVAIAKYAKILAEQIHSPNAVVL